MVNSVCVCYITLIISFSLRAFCFALTCMNFYLVSFRIPDFPSSPGIRIVSSILLATPAPQFGGICGFFRGASVWSPKLIMKILSKTCCRSSSSWTGLKCFVFLYWATALVLWKQIFPVVMLISTLIILGLRLQVMLNSVVSVIYTTAAASLRHVPKREYYIGLMWLPDCNLSFSSNLNWFLPFFFFPRNISKSS